MRASPYNSSTSEATVGAEPDDATGGPGTPGNQIAEIVDTLDTDTGELRYALGRCVARLRRVAWRWRSNDWTTLSENGDAFITLFNSDTNNAGAILDFRIRDDSFGVREVQAVHRHVHRFRTPLDAFMDVSVVTWEYPGGDTSPCCRPVTYHCGRCQSCASYHDPTTPRHLVA